MANFPHSEVVRRGNRSGRFSPLTVNNDNGSLSESSNFNSHVARGRVTRRNPHGDLEKYNVNASHSGHQVPRNFAYDRHAGEETPGQHLGYPAEYERDKIHSSFSRTRTGREGTHQHYMRWENGEASGKRSQEHKQLYNNCPEWTLKWEYRKSNLLKEIIIYNADIICLQEVEADHFIDWFQPKLLNNGYLGIYKQKTGRKTDGCAIFYRESRFILKCCRSIEYHVPHHSLMNRDNIGMIIGLQPKEEGVLLRKPPIFVANTHILFNKKRGDIKLLQLAMLFAEIGEIARTPAYQPNERPTTNQYNPVIICGDFNSTPLSSVYDFVTKGRLRYEGTCRETASGQVPQYRGSQSGNSNIFESNNVLTELGLTGLCQKQLDRKESDQSKGDTNAKDLSEDCVIMGTRSSGRTGTVEETGVLKHTLELRSAYRHHPGQRTVTSCQGTVDYILFSQGTTQQNPQRRYGARNVRHSSSKKQLYLTGVLSLLTEKDLSAMQTLPNPFISSDHLALLATFRLL
eukprot:gene2826-1056_t